MKDKETENNNELLKKDTNIQSDAGEASNSDKKSGEDAEKCKGLPKEENRTSQNRLSTARSTSFGLPSSDAKASQSRKELAQQEEATRLLREITSDPEIMDQALSAAVNPNVARELARQADTAWRNIEALPGGFRALCQMHHTIQQPLWQAVIGQDVPNKPNTGNNQNHGIPIDEPLDAQPLPNPWRSDFNSPASNSNSLRFNPFGSLSPLYTTGTSQSTGALNTTSVSNPFSFNTNSFQSASQIAENSASKYSKEIAEMAEMGLTDRDKCLTALEAAEGDLFQAIGIIQSLDELDNEENNEN